MGVDHCKQPEHWKVIEGAKIIYSAGFFVTVSQDAIKEASREQAISDQIYCMNLSAPFLMQVPPFKACFMSKSTRCLCCRRRSWWTPTALGTLTSEAFWL